MFLETLLLGFHCSRFKKFLNSGVGVNLLDLKTHLLARKTAPDGLLALRAWSLVFTQERQGFSSFKIDVSFVLVVTNSWVNQRVHQIRQQIRGEGGNCQHHQNHHRNVVILLHYA